MKINITLQELTAAYKQEQRENRPAVTAQDLPLSYEAITDQWLTAVLCRQHPEAKVVSHRLDTADEGNSNRRRIFLEYNETGQKAGLPQTVFCKATHGLANRISIGLGAFGEVNFYNKVRPLLPIEAPLSYFANINTQTRNSIIMLRDMSSETRFCTHTTKITRELAEDQMRILAHLHGQFLESPELDGLLQIFPTWTEFFVPLEALFEVPCDEGFAMAEDVIPDRLFERRDEIWQATLRSVERHRHLPHTLNHGDVHLRNWYITAAGAMGLTDWQGIIRGHWSRDVAYALATSLTIENRRQWEQELLQYYAEQLQAVSGKVIAFDEVWTNYRQQLFTVLAYWTITINPAPGMPDMQPRDVSVEFIKRITTAMDDVDSLGSFD